MSIVLATSRHCSIFQPHSETDSCFQGTIRIFPLCPRRAEKVSRWLFCSPIRFGKAQRTSAVPKKRETDKCLFTVEQQTSKTKQSSSFCFLTKQGPTWDGRSGVHVHMTNTRITDPEILERRSVRAIAFVFRGYRGALLHACTQQRFRIHLVVFLFCSYPATVGNFLGHVLKASLLVLWCGLMVCCLCHSQKTFGQGCVFFIMLEGLSGKVGVLFTREVQSPQFSGSLLAECSHCWLVCLGK